MNKQGNGKMSRPKLNDDGDPIFEIPYLFLPEPPSTLPKSLLEQYTHTQTTLFLLRDIWFIQLANPAHRNYWNIRAAHSFWLENGPDGFRGGRKLGWWYEGEGEGEGLEEDGVGCGDVNWITWGIERLEGELLDLFVMGKLEEGKGMAREGGKVGDDEEVMSVGSMRDIFSSSGVPPGSPRSLCSGGYGSASSQGFDPNPEANERLAEFLRVRDVDGDGDCEVVESIESSLEDAVFGIDNNDHHDNPFQESPSRKKASYTDDFERKIHSAFSSYPASKRSNGKRDFSQHSDSSGGICFADSLEDTYGRVRKSPKRSAEAAVNGDVAEEPISISSSRSTSSKTVKNGEIIEI